MFILKERFVTSGFRKPDRPKHDGVDYRANFVPLISPFDGTIIKQGNEPKDGDLPRAGEFYIFQPSFAKNMEFHFYHLSKRLVSNGPIKEGQQIGITGNSGHSTAPHLHCGIKKDGQWIDPELFNWDMKKQITLTCINRPTCDLTVWQNTVDKFSRGRIGIDFTFIDHPITQDHQMTGDEAHAVVSSVTPGKNHVFIFYSTLNAAFYTTYFLNGKTYTQAYLPGDPYALTFELSHQLDRMLGIPVQDALQVTDEFMFAKYDRICEKLDQMEQPTPPVESDMKFQLIKGDGSDVMVVRNGKGTLVLEPNVLELIADFSDIKQVPQAQFDAIEKTGSALALVITD